MASILLILLGAVLLVPGNWIAPLIDRDEPRFAQATREMTERNDWILPTFNGEDRFDKPVLAYWLMRGSYAIFGVNEFGARFHSVLSAIAVALLLYAMGRRWFSKRAGLAAAVTWLTSLQVLVHGRAAVADMPMVLCVTMAMWGIAQRLRIGIPEESQSRDLPPALRSSGFWVTWISVALGFLAKGPIALAVPAATLLLWRFGFWRRPVPWRNLRPGLGLVIVLVVVGSWGAPALLRTHGEFWRSGIGEHVVARGLRAFNGRTFLPIYYPFTALLSLFPWSIFVVAVWRSVRGNWSAATAFLVAWFLAPFLIFTFYATQLPHYVLPGFPPFFLLLGREWKRLQRRRVSLGLAVALAAVSIPIAGAWLRPRTPAIALQETLATLPQDAELAFYRYQEPSLIFYTNRHFGSLHGLDELNAFAARPGPRAVVVLESEGERSYVSELRGLDAAGLQVRRVSGWNVARGKPVTVRCYFRMR